MQYAELRGSLGAMDKKSIKLNPLQRRTLALFQVLARNPESSTVDEETGEVTVSYLPQPHGDHVHIGKFVVSGQEASGFSNEAVWRILARKGLIKSNFPVQATLTDAGLAYDTGLKDHFEESNH